MTAQLRPDPREQFEAARSLRAGGWSFFRISQALGITLSQVRVACDPKAQQSSVQWRSERSIGEIHRCTRCQRTLSAYDFPQHHSGTQGWKDSEGIHRRSECRACKRQRDNERRELRGRPTTKRTDFETAFEVTQPVRVPVGPFVEWITRKWAVFSVEKDGGIREFAASLGLSPREVDRYRFGEYSTVRWSKVDRVLVAEGSTDLWELYPDLYPREEAA